MSDPSKFSTDHEYSEKISTWSLKRREELQRRKEEVIAILNQTYADESEEKSVRLSEDQRDFYDTPSNKSI